MRDNIAQVALNPFECALHQVRWQRGMTLLDIAKAANVEEWFYQYGVIRINGHRYIEREMWCHIKPKQGVTVECCVELNRGAGKFIKKAIRVIAVVAVAVATKVATAINPVFGVVVGFAGQLAIKGLTPAPTRGGRSGAASNGRGGSSGRPGSAGGGGGGGSGGGSSGGGSSPEAIAQRELSQSGITTNTVAQGESLSFVIGRKRVSPNLLAPPWTTFENGRSFTHAIYGMMGRHRVTELKLNGIDFADVADLEYEVFEGDGGEGLSTIVDRTYFQEATGVLLSNFQTQNTEVAATKLVDQDNPENSYSKPHYFKSKGICDEVHFSLVWDGGIASTAGVRHSMPLRMWARRVGDVDWRAFPVLHFKDTKTWGGMRQTIKVVFGEPKEGVWFARNDTLDCHAAINYTAPNAAFAFASDGYFQDSTSPSLVPLLTSNLAPAPYVASSSGNGGGTLPFRAFDEDADTYWQSPTPINGSWIQIDHGSAVTVRSIVINANIPTAPAPTFNPRTFDFVGSNDAAFAISEVLFSRTETVVTDAHFIQLKVIKPFRYHRLVLKTGQGATSVRISELSLYGVDNACSTVDAGPSGGRGGSVSFSRYTSLDTDGAEIYLLESAWPRGEYEFQLQRGMAYITAGLSLDITAGDQTSDRYDYTGSAFDTSSTSHFFGSYLSGQNHLIRVAQNTVTSRCIVESVTTVENTRPINPIVERGLTRIAIRVPDIQVDSVSGIFEGYARTFTGGIWQDQMQLTRNPAAYFRDALLRPTLNALPVNGALIDEDSLQSWFTECQIKGHTCDMIVQGRSIADVLAALAAAGYSSIRKSETIGVVMDRDRSAEPVTQMLTPFNSRSVVTRKPFKEIPHALRVEFSDGAADERSKSVIVYRDGFDASNARLIESIGYEGLDTEAKNVARAQFDLCQMKYRNWEVVKEVGLEGLSLERGTLVEVADDVILRDIYVTLVRDVIVDAGNVTGLVLETVVELSQSFGQTSFEGDILDPTTSFGFKLRTANGTAASHEIVETADTDIVALVTPVADTGQFERGSMITIGPFGRESRRMIVLSRDAAGFENYTVTLLPEAPELFS